jgi:predicted RNase H-like nuclease (RuvC/YqgF family)
MSENLPTINRDAIASLTLKHQQLRSMSESNGKAIAAITEQLRDNQTASFDLVKTNSQSIRDLITSLQKLQFANQANSELLTAQQQILQEFQQSIQEMSDRIEKQHQQTQHQLAQLTEQVQFLNRNYISLQTETITMLEKFASDS